MRIVIAFAAALTLISASAHAERIEVAKFRGSRRVARAVRKDVIQVLRKDNDLVRHGAAGVVKAKIRKRGSKYSVRLYLVDRFGDTAKKIGFKVSRRGMSSHQKRLLRKKLRHAISRLPKDEPEVADDDGFEEDDAVEDDAVADASEDAKDEDAKDEDAKDEDKEDSGVSKSVGAPSALPDAEVSAGLSVIQRTFTFGADQGNYNGVPAGGAYVEAQIYPLAFDKKAKGLKNRLGVGLEYDHSIGLKSSFPEDPGTQLATTQSRLTVDARYRYPLGKGPRAAMVIGSVGYEKLSFTIDRTAAPDNVTIMVPNTAYTSVTPGASIWYPVSDKIALAASAHVKLVLGAGDVTTGTQYGTGSAFGYDADGGVQYDVNKKVMIRAGAYLAKVSLSLDGNGDLSAMGNFTSASDTYLGGYATAGFRL